MKDPKDLLLGLMLILVFLLLVFVLLRFSSRIARWQSNRSAITPGTLVVKKIWPRFLRSP
jgi:hypothetical protein